MPWIGRCIDRRTLSPLNLMLEDVHSMICFGCAQIHAHCPLWKTMYTPGGYGLHTSIQGDKMWSEHPEARWSLNHIELHTVADSLRRFYMRAEDRFRLHFDLALFKRRYASSHSQRENPFRNSDVLTMCSHGNQSLSCITSCMLVPKKYWRPGLKCV